MYPSHDLHAPYIVTDLAVVVLHPFAHLPSTLEQIFPANSEMLPRYTRLVKQKFYEKTAGTVYCPRPSCQHPTIPANETTQVIVCSRCTYPFCKWCRSTWHGAEVSCRPQNGYPPPTRPPQNPLAAPTCPQLFVPHFGGLLCGAN